MTSQLQNLTDLWLAALAAAANEATEPGAAEAILRRLVEAGAGDAAAILRASPPDWQVLAATHPELAPPSELAADAIDSGQATPDSTWTAAPLPRWRDTEQPAALLIQNCSPGCGIEGLAINLADALQLTNRLRGSEGRAARLAALLEMTKSWSGHSNLRSLLEQMAEAATQLFDADRASIFLWDRTNNTLVGRPALGIEGGELRIPDDAGVVGAVLSSGEAQRVSPRNDDAI